jgi:deoxyribodipyrimidine photo-lyase
MIPQSRIHLGNNQLIHSDGDYVLYWMTSARRSHFNFALDRSLEYAQALTKPLIVLEALRCDYPWASVRFHGFINAGMADNARRFRQLGLLYYPYVEPAFGRGRGLLEAFASKACVVVTDDCPSFFFPPPSLPPSLPGLSSYRIRSE